MSFRYKLIAVILVFALAAGVYYIGYKNNQVEEVDEKTTRSQTENVYFWYNDESMTDFFLQAAVAFNEKYPDIRIAPTLVTDSDYLETINKASVEGVNFPDAYIITNDALEKAYLAGLASEAQNKVALQGGHFCSPALNAVTFQGKYVGYPLFFETSVLVYNKTYLDEWVEQQIKKAQEEAEEFEFDESDMVMNENEEYDTEYSGSEAEERNELGTVALDDPVPKTINEIKAIADGYDAPDGVEGVFKWDVSDIFYNYFFAGKYLNVGGTAGDKENTIDIYNYQTIRCLKAYQDLNQFFSIDAETSNYEDTIKEFLEGKYMFTIATSDVIKTIEQAQAEATEKRAQQEAEYAEKLRAAEAEAEANAIAATPKKEDPNAAPKEEGEPLVPEPEYTKVFEFGYAKIPDVTSTLVSGSLSVTEAVVVNGYSEHKFAANQFAAFLTTTYASELYPRTGKISAYKDVEYENEALITFQEEYEDSVPLPKIIEASNYWVQLEVLYTKAWTGEDVNELLRVLSGQIKTQITGTEVIEEKLPEIKESTDNSTVTSDSTQ